MADEYTIAEAVKGVLVGAGYKRTEIVSMLPQPKHQNHPGIQCFIMIGDSEVSTSDADDRGVVTIIVQITAKSMNDAWGVSATKLAYQHKTVIAKLLTQYRESGPNLGNITKIVKSVYPTSKNTQWVAALSLIFQTPFAVT